MTNGVSVNPANPAVSATKEIEADNLSGCGETDRVVSSVLIGMLGKGLLLAHKTV